MFVWFKRLVSWGAPSVSLRTPAEEYFRQLHIRIAKDVVHIARERLGDRDYLTQLLIIGQLQEFLEVVERVYPDCAVERDSPTCMAVSLARQSNLAASWEAIDFIVQQLGDNCDDDNRLWLIMRGMVAPAHFLRALEEESSQHDAGNS